MKFYTPTPLSVLCLFLCICLFNSCSKDSDLLAEYVTQDSINPEGNYSTQNGESEEDPANDPNSDSNNPNEPVNQEDLGELRAFPGAVGFGKYATGGRGGIVVEVTNLNDSGPGSFRDALKMKVPRTIVFKVGGTIDCQSYLTIPSDAGNLTIAGQTAPGGGIQIKNGELRIQASNVIVRHLKIRLGHDVTDTNEDGVRIIAFNGKHTQNVVIDHCSVYWGIDENFEIGGIGSGSRVSNVTVQNCIVAENIIGSKYGILLWNRANNISFYRNLFAHNEDRNINSSTCGSSFEMVNNITYGYKTGTQPTYENYFDVIGNVYITNPNVSTRNETLRLQASTNNCPDGSIGLTKCYVDDNLLNGGDITISSKGANNLLPYLENSPVMSSGINPAPASTILNNILAQVGASINRDATDARVINEVKNRSGSLYNNDANARNFPSINSGNAYTDSDRDGMSDEWELSNGLNPNDGSDGNADANGDGYTNLEAFLHDLTQPN